MDRSIGVRQGACEGPILLLFIMQAAPETMEWPNRKRGAMSFGFFTSLFANGCAISFETGEDMVKEHPTS